MLKTFLSLIGALLLLCMTVVGVWAWAPDRTRASLEAKYLTGLDTYRDAAGDILRVRDSGPKDAPVVILIHGFASSLETWESWAQTLSVDHRVVRFDLPGSGLSRADATDDYSDGRTLEVVKALMDKLGIDRATLIGNSVGGRIAWLFAAHYPQAVIRLVLISPDGFASPGFEYDKAPEVPAILGLMKYFLPKRLLRMNLAPAYADPARLTASTVDRYYDLLLAPNARNAMLVRLRQTRLQDPRPTLAAIHAPTLLLWGEKDRLIPFTNAADYLGALPNVVLVSFPLLGHVPQEELPTESLKPVLRFLGG